MALLEPHKHFDFLHYPHRLDNIEADDGEVLPQLPGWAIRDALRRLPADELATVLRTKVVPLVNIPGLRLFAAFGDRARRAAHAAGLEVAAGAEATDFLDAAQVELKGPLLRRATRELVVRFPEMSASRRFSPSQTIVSLLLVVLLVAALWFLPPDVLWSLSSLVGGLFFLSVIALRLLSLMPPPRRAAPARPIIDDGDLPIYSVLIPLFRETAVLGQLLSAIRRLDYPRDKLDVKLILEESDIVMQRAVARYRLPDWIDVLVVPSGLPQTKPRALNYALQFARGELLTIFDAEDIPEPQQLRLAAERFAVLGPDVACLQAQLAFYNPNENWLTRQFTIEYATLFGLQLPALAGHHLPLPLGGTSNHFRTPILQRIGAWDPYNVTEDADLGLRLARFGYETGTLDSRTYEEANVRLLNWMRQRARWLKGFLQTWLVHMRRPDRFLADVGASGFWVSQAFTIGLVASALLHPVCLAVTLWMFGTGQAFANAGLLATGLAGLNLAVLVSGYAVTMMAGHRALRREAISGWWFPIATMPVYWLLISAAAWLAVWQFTTAPFNWNKTEHGLSVFQRQRARQVSRDADDS